MKKNKQLSSLIQEHKVLFIIIIVGMFLLEMEIFAVAVAKSGRKSRLQVIDQRGNLIHETDGRHLSEFNKYYFEKTFGPFENYQVKLKTQNLPFPFRAWFVAAAGLPIGIMLLFAFVIKAWQAVFYNEKEPAPANPSPKQEKETRLERIIEKITRLNIFVIGFLIFSGVFLYWILPNFATYIGKTGIDFLIRYKMIVLAGVLILLGIMIWIIYLKYLLAKKSIESQTELDKLRLELDYNNQNDQNQLQIESNSFINDKSLLCGRQTVEIEPEITGREEA